MGRASILYLTHEGGGVYVLYLEREGASTLSFYHNKMMNYHLTDKS